MSSGFSFRPCRRDGIVPHYRLAQPKIPEISQDSTALGAKLVQKSCDEADAFELFYVLALNTTDFFLQGVKSQYCFDL
jgi:hypothetical protein